MATVAYLPNVGDRVTINHPTFASKVHVVTAVGSQFVEVAPEIGSTRGHANFSFGVKASDLQPVLTIKDPTYQAIWDDIGRYHQGDHRAWAFVNYLCSDLPYA